MFVQHKQLQYLNIPADKVAHLHVASSSVQLAFSGYPPQLNQAYLLQINGENKALVVVAFYLIETRASIFFVPKFGEVEFHEVETVYEEGYAFVESMGFVLTETDYHLLAADKKRSYWSGLPICQAPTTKKQNGADTQLSPQERSDYEKALKHSGDRSLKSLGRFLASM